MKLIVKEKDGCCESVNIEYTPAEALIINQAMRLYLENDYVHETDRDIMRRMLEVEPIFEEVNDDNRIKVGDEVEIYGTGSIAVVMSIDKYRKKNYYRCVKYNGDLCTENDTFPPTKTGRHFPQITEVLKQMQEGSGEE